MTGTEIHPELVRRAQQGDRESLEALVEAAYPKVRRWALVRTGDPTEADDLTQDVMIQMIRRLDGYQGSARFDTWLYSVTRNAATDRGREATRRSRLLGDPRAVDSLTPEAAPLPDDGAGLDPVGAGLHQVFQELPLRQREVFDLVELQGLTSFEAAQRLGIEAVSVRAHLFRARRALRTRILTAHPHLAEDTP
ncbi:MAG TPA: RNA polymerase sigma factor [Longimicrobiales bacterium]|nr:RNA polymerase sigma factor [Longimicrobiales bacterium]